MYILGVSSYYHDSSAALIKDGRVITACEEERFSRLKHDNKFPSSAITACLEEAGVSITDVQCLAYYEKPLLKFERIMDTFVQTYPFSLTPFVRGVPEWLGEKIRVEKTIRQALGFKGEVYFIPHHVSHAAATFYPSPFKKTAILTIDGVGEYQTTGLWYGDGNKLKPLKALNFPHSLGLLYSTFTSFLGFKVNEDEYKVMGLAAYGQPAMTHLLRKIVDLKSDGSFKLNLKYFSFREKFRMWSTDFEKVFGPPRTGGSLSRRDKNLAASLQVFTEEVYLKMLEYLFSITTSTNLCLSGGVALNALANGKIYKSTPFKRVYALGPAGDSGGAIGAALFVYHSLLKNERRKRIETLTLGTRHTNGEIEKLIKEGFLKRKGLQYKKFQREEKLLVQVAKALKQGKVIGWYQGRMEFGPRALGARSILARPAPRDMKDRVNKVKGREMFRPFAGSILQENAHEYFEIPRGEFPFMNFCFKVKADKAAELEAIVHKDGTSRIQTVSKRDGRYYNLIKTFYEQTGIPCLLNTSFNLSGEPIVESPAQAVDDFLRSQIDYLIIEDYLFSKKLRTRN